LILDKIIEIEWNQRNRKYYELLGYRFTKKNDKFFINTRMLQKLSKVKVNVCCDECGIKLNYPFRAYNENVNKYGLYLCKHCICSDKYRKIHTIKNNPEYTIGQYIVDTYSKKFKDPLNIFWSKLNTESPWNVSRGTRKTYYFACEHGHPPYLTKPLSFICGHKCPYCTGQKATKENSFASFHTENTDSQFIEKYWDYDLNDTDPYELTVCSSKKIWLKCPENESHSPYLLFARDFTYWKRCPECTQLSKESALQAKVREYLSTELGYKTLHEEQCTIIPINPETRFPLPFDNEVVDLRLIIEVHGGQH